MATNVSDALKICYWPEATFGTAPLVTDKLTRLRFQGNSIKAAPERVDSDEIDVNRESVRDIVEVFRKSAGDLNVELTPTDYYKFFAAALCGTLTPVSASYTCDIGFTPISKLTLATDWPAAFDGQPMFVRVTGATNPLNNGIKMVLARGTSATELWFQAGSFVEAQTGATVTLYYNTANCGTTLKSFTFQKQYTSLSTNNYANFHGLSVDKITLKLASKQKITAAISFVGGEYHWDTDHLGDGTPTEPSTDPVLATGLFPEAMFGTLGAQDYPIESVELTIANNLLDRPVLGQQTSNEFGLGKLEITGKINAYFENHAAAEAFYTAADATSYGLWLFIGKASVAKMGIYLPKIQLTNGNPEEGASGTDMMLPMEFRACRHATLPMAKLSYVTLA